MGDIRTEHVSRITKEEWSRRGGAAESNKNNGGFESDL